MSEPAPPRTVEVTVDGRKVTVREGATLLDACKSLGIEVPTFCWAENLTPVNVCRICVVELEGARTLAPACSRKAEPGMVVKTDSQRVRLSRKLVLELLGSSVDMSLAPDFGRLAKQLRRRARSASAPGRRARRPGSARRRCRAITCRRASTTPRTWRQPVKVDNELFVRDYERCMLCYKCVEACGTDAQNTFAIAVAGRGFEARITTEHDTPLGDSACVFCGNCVGVCPTGALMFKAEHDLRAAKKWDESKQTVTDTICPYCGVGCTLTLRVQDNQIVRVTSPSDSSVTGGHLCVKGRFGATAGK